MALVSVGPDRSKNHVAQTACCNANVMRDAPPRAVRADGAGQEGSSPSRVWPDTRDCRRDIARYMPTRSGRRGRCSSKPPRARASERRIATGAMHCISCTAKEREKGEGGNKKEEREKEKTSPASRLLFLSSRAFVHATRLPLLCRGSRVFVNQLTLLEPNALVL